VPALDHYHNTVKRALIKDGWTISDDPLSIHLPERNLFIDLRAEKVSDRLSVILEIKGFGAASQIEALASAIGKYNLYQAALAFAGNYDPLYLAVPIAAYNGIISETIGQRLIAQEDVKLLVFDPESEELIQWIV
jgi:hypothetical protein